MAGADSAPAAGQRRTPSCLYTEFGPVEQWRV